MTDFERRVEVATAAMCSPNALPQTRRKIRRMARRAIRGLEANGDLLPAAETPTVPREPYERADEQRCA